MRQTILFLGGQEYCRGMTKAMRPGFEYSDDAFTLLTQGLDMGLSTLPYDGTPVMVDYTAGEEFKEDMRRKFIEVMQLPSEIPFAGEAQLNEQAAELVNETLAARLLAPTAPIRAGSWLAINGTGLVAGVENLDDGYDVCVLDGSTNLFGRLIGIGYGEYPFTPDISTVNSASAIYAGELCTGLIVVLDKVKLCDAEGYGQLDEELYRAIAPVAVDTLRYHAALADISLL